MCEGVTSNPRRTGLGSERPDALLDIIGLVIWHILSEHMHWRLERSLINPVIFCQDGISLIGVALEVAFDFMPKTVKDSRVRLRQSKPIDVQLAPSQFLEKDNRDVFHCLP